MAKLYYTIFSLVAIAAIILLGIDSFYTIVRNQISFEITEDISVKNEQNRETFKKPPVRNYDVIARRNIFSQAEEVPETDDIPDIENLEPTSLNIALRGTYILNHGNSTAIIEDRTKRTQDIYRIGDSIQEGTIKNILRRQVVLRVNGIDEILTMDETIEGPAGPTGTPAAPTPKRTAAGPAASRERTINVRREDIDKSLANLNQLLSEASIQPNFTDGRPDGLAITGIEAGSIFRRLGLRNGDVVKGVGGRDIRNPEDLIGLYNNLKSDSDITLDVVRRGQDYVFRYRFR